MEQSESVDNTTVNRESTAPLHPKVYFMILSLSMMWAFIGMALLVFDWPYALVMCSIGVVTSYAISQKLGQHVP